MSDERRARQRAGASMRVLVCGSRTFSDRYVLRTLLYGLREMLMRDEPIEVISGMARGADALAAEWARFCGHTLHEFPADWDKHGKAAGPIRNQQMLDEGKPDVVWAFVDKPLAESRGTADMVRRAKAAGVPVRVVEVQ